jgi:glutathione S-transferase
MMADLIFYTNPQSRGQIVRWMLEEVGAPYDQRLLDFGTTMKAPDYLAINPMGKVPAIVHRGRIVTECGAICTYLAEAFPDAGLAPLPEERADYYRWMFFAAGPVEAAVANNAAKVVTPPEMQRMYGYGTFEKMVEVLRTAVAGKRYIYICGDRFTAADVYVGSEILWGKHFGLLPDAPEFSEYAARLEAREAYGRAKAIDNALAAEAKGTA